MSAAARLNLAGLAAVTDAGTFAAATQANAEQLTDLERLHELLADWNERMNLVSAASLDAYWPRHAFDSAQLLDFALDARVWVDIGAGAGFPGLVLAILLKGAGKTTSGARVHLVESQAKRCRFLSAAAEALALPAMVHNLRGEDFAVKADIVTARAVAPLVKLLGFARPCMARGARGLFLKSEGVEAEIAEARKTWRFACEIAPSRSDPRGRILTVERLARV